MSERPPNWTLFEDITLKDLMAEEVYTIPELASLLVERCGRERSAHSIIARLARLGLSYRNPGYSAAEVMRLLNVSAAKAYSWVNSGKLEAKRLTPELSNRKSKWLITDEQVVAFLQKWPEEVYWRAIVKPSWRSTAQSAVKRYNLTQAAKIAGVHRSTILRAIGLGEIRAETSPFRVIRGKVLIPRSELLDWIASRRSGVTEVSPHRVTVGCGCYKPYSRRENGGSERPSDLLGSWTRSANNAEREGRAAIG